jgi:hypothetical protein
MHDAAWRPHPPIEDELPPGYSWSSYPDALQTEFPDDDAPVLFPLPVSRDLRGGRAANSPGQRHSPPPGPVEPRPVDPDAFPPANPQEEAHLCVVVGARGAGKTSLVASWARQAGAQDPEARVLAIVPADGFQAFTDDADAAFEAVATARRAASWLREGVLRVQSAMGHNGARWVIRELHADAVLGDAQASPAAVRGGLFARSQAMDAVQRWSSVALVLCIDGASPRRDLWLRALPRRLVAWAQAAATEPALDAPPQGLLPFDRVLVVVTKLDRFCLQAATLARHTRTVPHAAIAALPANQLAQRIDPGPQVRALLGDEALGQLLSSLKPGATLAAALTSVAGFGRSSVPDPLGPPPWRYAEWCPFGTREALRYLNGAAPAFPLAALDRGDLRPVLVPLAP